MLAVLAAFFCLLFFAAAKRSRCRPAQGRRLKHDNKTRMPAKRSKHRTATLEARRHSADTSANPKKPNQPRRALSLHAPADAAAAAPHRHAADGCARAARRRAHSARPPLPIPTADDAPRASQANHRADPIDAAHAHTPNARHVNAHDARPDAAASPHGQADAHPDAPSLRANARVGGTLRHGGRHAHRNADDACHPGRPPTNTCCHRRTPRRDR